MKENIIEIPQEIQLLFEEILGKDCDVLGLYTEEDMLEYKTYIQKLLKAIIKAIKVNIDVCDTFYKRDLLDHCDFYIEKIKLASSFELVHLYMIDFLTRLIFMMLGNMPDHSEMGSANHNSHWKLDKFGKVVYIQEQRQKVNLILSLPERNGYESLPDKKDLYDIYTKKFKGNNSSFIDWFKKNYPKLYLEIF